MTDIYVYVIRHSLNGLWQIYVIRHTFSKCPKPNRVPFWVTSIKINTHARTHTHTHTHKMHSKCFLNGVTNINMWVVYGSMQLRNPTPLHRNCPCFYRHSLIETYHGINTINWEIRKFIVLEWQCPLSAPLVCGPQMVCVCACVRVCVQKELEVFIVLAYLHIGSFRTMPVLYTSTNTHKHPQTISGQRTNGAKSRYCHWNAIL